MSVRNQLLAAAYLETWAICQRWLEAALTIQVAMDDGDSRARMPTVKGDVAILPLHGPISQRGSIWQELFGGTSTEQFGAAYTRAVNESRIGAVVINVDSPGGTTAGVQELAEIVHRGSKIKPTYAIANSQAASAAYWIGSQVGKGSFYAAPGAEVGSIGVYRMHQDVSEALAKEGVKVRFISVPEHKTEANPYEPLTPEAYQHHYEMVQATYEQFAGDVARGRGVNSSTVKDGYGKGRSFNATRAYELGMVDGVATLTGLMKRLGGKTGSVFQNAEVTAVADTLCEAWESGVCSDIPEPMPTDARKQRLEYLTRTLK